MSKRVVVYHGGYGCETGCCGHWVSIGEDGDHARPDNERFIFDHSEDADPLEFAKKLVTQAYGAEHVADLNWDECIIVDGDNC